MFEQFKRQHVTVGYETFEAGAAVNCPEALAKSFGPVIAVTEVRINPQMGTYLCGFSPIPLHTDHPLASKIVWHCHVQDPKNGATVLSNGWKAYTQLTKTVRQILSEIYLMCPSFLGRSPKAMHPFVDEEREEIFYAPWLMLRGCSGLQKEAIATFLNALKSKESDYVEIRLKAGEILVVNNHQILHGRDRINENSPRHLTRYWISEF